MVQSGGLPHKMFYRNFKIIQSKIQKKVYSLWEI